MKKQFILALVFCLMFSISILADGETHAGGRTDCPPEQSCSAATTSSSNSVSNLIVEIVNLIIGK